MRIKITIIIFSELKLLFNIKELNWVT